MKKTEAKEDAARRNIRARQAKIRREAAKRPEAILNEPKRRAQEERFAAAHQNDSDEALLLYVKAEKARRKKRFKRSRLIGYAHLMERFGSWGNVITPVNEMLRKEEETRRESTWLKRRVIFEKN